jgi:hypothetical protein
MSMRARYVAVITVVRQRKARRDADLECKAGVIRIFTSHSRRVQERMQW